MSEDIKLELAAAKNNFSQRMIANDTFFALVSRRLISDDQLPDFSCEPYIRSVNPAAPYENSNAGIQVAYSSLRKVEKLPELSFGLTMYNHIELLSMNNGRGIPATGIVEELNGFAEIANPNAAWKDLANDWLTSYNGIIRQFKDHVAISPLTHTIELSSELRNMFYSVADSSQN